MNYELTDDQIASYRENGFLVVDDFLNAEELEEWRDAVTEAIAERNGIKIPGKDIKVAIYDDMVEIMAIIGRQDVTNRL